LYRGREAGKTQAGKKRPANRAGKRAYTHEVIAAPQPYQYLKKDRDALKLKGKSLTNPFFR
jgi:hypothetical protein